ncbi:MAG: DUF5305 family protein, partial [Halobacteria archaeon]|nr:DUF5305 family protein [Halobacteria archaeon]
APGMTGIEVLRPPAGTVNVSSRSDSPPGPVTLTRTSFTLGGTLDVSRSHAETTERKVPKGGSTTFALLSLGLVSFISARVVRDWDISFDVEAARRELHEARYSEWISEGSVPEEADASVRMESLEDLVDVAIDSNRRVIHDADEGVYAVIDDATSYYYVDGDDGNEEES